MATALGKFAAFGPFAALVFSSGAIANDGASKTLERLGLNRRLVSTVPMYPASSLKRHQEGWAQVSIVVQPDGSVIDPILILSSGVEAFSSMAIRAVNEFKYEPLPPDEKQIEQSPDTVYVEFALEENSDGLSRAFRRHHERITEHLQRGDLQAAEARIKKAENAGKWKISEYSQLWLLRALLAEARGDHAEQYWALRRAIRQKQNALEHHWARELLPDMLRLEMSFSLLSDAVETHEMLEDLSLLSREDEGLDDLANRLMKVVNSDHTLGTRAMMPLCTDCESLWTYKPLRRSFTFANVEGAITRLDLRCVSGRHVQEFQPDVVWSIPESWGRCRLIVFGKGGTTFDYLEPATLN